MQEIFKKLDLLDYIDSFSKLLAREKSIIMEGDINLHYRLINELSSFDFKEPAKLTNLDNALLLIQKQGILKIYEIYEFIKIIDYFNYLKKFAFEGKLQEWMDKIIIPQEITNICDYFDDKSKLKTGVNEEYDAISEAIYRNKQEIKQNLYKTINSSKLKSIFS